MDLAGLGMMMDYCGARDRCCASRACREWREAGQCERGWERAYRRRWWHCACPAAAAAAATAAERRWRAGFRNRIVAEQRLGLLLWSAQAEAIVRDVSSAEGSIARKVLTMEIEATASSGEDVRQLAASIGALAGSPVCSRHFVALGTRLRPPPPAETLKAFVAEAVGKARFLHDDVVAELAATALAAASASRGWAACCGKGPEAGLDVVASRLRLFYDGHGVEEELRRLGDLARTAAGASPLHNDDEAIVRGVERVFTREGFRGNADEYYEPENSLLDAVIERRLGIPISLAALFIAIAERAGITPGALTTINAPGHFLLRFRDDTFLDVFQTPVRRLGYQAALAFLTHHNTSLAQQQQHHVLAARRALVAPLSAEWGTRRNHDVWRRVLRNLAYCYSRLKDKHSLFVVLSVHLALEDDLRASSAIMSQDDDDDGRPNPPPPPPTGPETQQAVHVLVSCLSTLTNLRANETVLLPLSLKRLVARADALRRDQLLDPLYFRVHDLAIILVDCHYKSLAAFYSDRHRRHSLSVQSDHHPGGAVSS